MSLSPLYLLAGYVVFRLASFAMVRNAEVRKFWDVRVAVAVLAGLTLWKLTPFFTRSETVFDNPLLLLYMNGGLAALTGGLFMGAGVLAFGLWQIRREAPVARWRLLVPLALGGVLAAGLWLAQPLWEAPAAIAADSAQLLVPTLDGTKVALVEARGKVLVVNFWATWCPPCKAELPELLDFSRKHGSGIALWGVDLIGTEVGGETPVKAYLDSHKMRWPQLFDEGGTLARAYGVTAVPTTLVFDRQLRLVERRVGAVDLAWLMGLEARYGR